VLTLKISTTNAAFDGDDGQWEIIRLLEVAILKIKQGNQDGMLLDINGNKVGAYRIRGVKVQ
jgi:hypothetical protein